MPFPKPVVSCDFFAPCITCLSLYGKHVFLPASSDVKTWAWLVFMCFLLESIPGSTWELPVAPPSHNNQKYLQTLPYIPLQVKMLVWAVLSELTLNVILPTVFSKPPTPVYGSGLDAHLFFFFIVPVIPSPQPTVLTSHRWLPLVGLFVLFLQLTLQGQKSCFIHC